MDSLICSLNYLQEAKKKAKKQRPKHEEQSSTQLGT
jgi:hypothetical protein